MLVRQILQKTNDGLDLLRAYYGRELRKDGKGYRTKDGKVSIRKGTAFDVSCWYATDFTGEYESGNPFSIRQRERGLGPGEAIKSLAAELGIEVDANYKPEPRPARMRKPETPVFPYLVNNDRNKKPNTSYDFGVADKHVATYPKRIRTETLERYQVEPVEWISYKGGKKTYSTEKDPIFVFRAGANTKLYRPKGFRKGGKQRPATYAGNYVFGFDQLPTTCKYILITAGQNDTLAANQALNNRGIYAVCLWSESSASYLTPELLDLLQEKCESVFVAYDDDKTGNRTALDFPVESLQIPHRYGVNDLCDVLDKGVSEDELADLVESLIASTIAARTDVLDAPINASELWIEGYIQQDETAVEKLVEFYRNENRIQIVAPTGSGKTTFVFEYLRKRFASVDNPFIFAVPTQALADQVGKKYNLPVIMEGADEYDLEYCEHKDSIVCTYDSLPRIKHLVPTCSALFFDESHHLVSDSARSFKFAQMHRAFSVSELAPRVVLISATPCPFMNRKGFRFIRLNQISTSPMNIRPVEVSKEYMTEVFTGITRTQQDGKVDVVFWDSKDKLADLKKHLVGTKRYEESEIAVLTSHTKRDSLVLEQIKMTGKIPEGIKVILATRLIADGISIYGKNIGNIHAVSVRNEELFLQFPARFRDLDEMIVYSYRYHKPSNLNDPLSWNEYLQYSLSDGRKALCEIQVFPYKYSHLKAINPKYKESDQDRFKHLFYEKDKGFEASFLYACFDTTNNRDNMTTPEQFYQRIANKYPHVRVDKPIKMDGELDETVKASIKSEKRIRKQLEYKAYQEVMHQPDEAIAYAVCTVGTDGDEVGIDASSPEVQAKAEEVRKRNQEFKEYRIRDPFKRLHRMVSFGLTPTEAASLLERNRNLRSNKGFGTWESRLFVQMIFAGFSAPDPISAIRMNDLRKIKRVLLPLIGQEFTREDLERQVRSLIKEATGSPAGKDVMKYVRELFLVRERKLTKDENPSRGRVYALARPLNLADLVGEGAKNRILEGIEKTQVADNQESYGNKPLSIYKQPIAGPDPVIYPPAEAPF